MIITGEKVILRSISGSDTTNILRWRNSDTVKQFFIDRRELTSETHTQWLKNKVFTGKTVQFIIVNKTTNTDIGTVYLRDVDFYHKKAEFGVYIGETCDLGKGYGTESAKLICEYGFNELHLNKISLRVISSNIRACKSYEKIGFVTEGTFKEDIWDGENFLDVIFMSLFEKKFHK